MNETFKVISYIKCIYHLAVIIQQYTTLSTLICEGNIWLYFVSSKNVIQLLNAVAIYTWNIIEYSTMVLTKRQ